MQSFTAQVKAKQSRLYFIDSAISNGGRICNPPLRTVGRIFESDMGIITMLKRFHHTDRFAGYKYPTYAC
ncbi:hypothetical protein [Neisseria montereyensis]|uniref:Uncharacterized protein n=1 Tax=Neisseria montereyensis TaxID=2973938 RepID=A0ABT2F9L8_9NEIS|nr:hypothetical protein [Neisseria montereyensis]MCS4532896.1 hypothetical protein [Neisseria montereyensis]